MYAFAIEKTDKKIIPKLYLGEDDSDKKTEETSIYTGPTLHISLGRRAACGTNAQSNFDFFTGNVISGAPKYKKDNFKTGDTPDSEYEGETALVITDNEIIFILKTRTIKEQFQIINILERALNIYCRSILSEFVYLCGVKDIKSEKLKDEQKLETMTINFQIRLKEILKIDRSFILKSFNIFSGKEDSFEYSSGQIKNEKWEENIPEEIKDLFP